MTFAFLCVKTKEMAQRPRSDNKLMKKSYNIYFKRHCSGEKAPALRNKKDNFYFILFLLLTAKVYAKPVLKIFALADCGYAFFLLSANICQTTLFGQERIVLKIFKINYTSESTLLLGRIQGLDPAVISGN